MIYITIGNWPAMGLFYWIERMGSPRTWIQADGTFAVAQPNGLPLAAPSPDGYSRQDVAVPPGDYVVYWRAIAIPNALAIGAVACAVDATQQVLGIVIGGSR